MKIYSLLFITGLFLLVLNLVGLFLPLKNPDIYHEQKNYFKDDITLSVQDFFSIQHKKRNSVEQDVYVLNNAVNKAIAHYWEDEGIDKYNLRIPVYENYILFIASFIYPEHFEKYEFFNYKKAIERGVGLCSQQVLILSQILDENGYNTRLLHLPGHLMLMILVDEVQNYWWIVDPTLDVIIKEDRDELIENPEIIEKYENENGFTREKILFLKNIFSSKDLVMFEGPKEYFGKIYYYIELYSYTGIWIIPVILMIPWSMVRLRNFH